MDGGNQLPQVVLEPPYSRAHPYTPTYTNISVCNENFKMFPYLDYNSKMCVYKIYKYCTENIRYVFLYTNINFPNVSTLLFDSVTKEEKKSKNKHGLSLEVQVFQPVPGRKPASSSEHLVLGDMTFSPAQPAPSFD